MADQNPTTPTHAPAAKGFVPAASKSEKFNAAVNRATGATAVTGPAPLPIGDAAAMFSQYDPSDLNKLAMSGGYEFAPQMMSLEPGQKVEGILEGYGPGNDFTNETTGEIRHVDSWIIASPDGSLRISILSSAQLDTKLPPFLGGSVIIARKADIKLAGGHKCADYHVGGARLASGVGRKWGMLPTVAEPVALPAGVVDANPPAQIAAAPAVANGAHAAS